MDKEMILEKQQQAAKILNELDIDMWMTFLRESSMTRDPMMEMIVGTNCTWQSAFIITRTGETIAIIGSLEEGNMKQVGTYKRIECYLTNVKDKLLEVLNEINPNKIAINYSLNSTLADGLTHGMYLELTSHLEGTPFKDMLISSEDVVASLRGRKSHKELALMKTAIAETVTILDQVTGFIAPGKSEQDVAKFVQNIVEEKGFGYAWEKEYCPSVFTGPDTAGAHAGPTDKKIEPGHVINMDFGINYKGYCSDLQRTWYVLKDGEDKAPEAVQKGFDVIRESITKAAEGIKPGIQGCIIDDIARNYITSFGYAEYPHALGHQVGRVAHDGGALLSPRWERYGNLPYLYLEEGQIFTIEPRLTIEGYGIATIEEEVIITKDGCEFISPRQEELYLIKP